MIITVAVWLLETRITIATVRFDTIDVPCGPHVPHTAIVDIFVLHWRMGENVQLFAVCFERGLVFARLKTCITGLDSLVFVIIVGLLHVLHSRAVLRLGTSRPLAPSDQLRTETASLRVFDGDQVELVLGRDVQVFQVLPPRLARRLRSSHLSACCWHCSFCHGSLGPNPGCFLHGSLGPSPCLFLFLHVQLARVSSSQDVVVTLVSAE